MKEIAMGLCKGRHEMPVNEYIFGNELNPLDYEGMYQTAYENIPEDTTDLTVYVTGLTAAMLAVVKVCDYREISLTAMHYDRESGEYYPQVILRFDRCAFCGKPMPVYSWACPHCGAT